MNHMHQEPDDQLDLDKPGYYFPKVQELHEGMEVEVLGSNQAWIPLVYTLGMDLSEVYNPNNFRVKYLQAKDVQSLGFRRISQGIPMYQLGSYTIVAKRLFDPTFARVEISHNGVLVSSGFVPNKSELKRILILNEINFVEQK